MPQREHDVGGRPSRKIIISPSIIAADYARIGEELQAVTAAGADWIHLDIMDGHFVPNLTIGPDFIRAVRQNTELFLDAHLMIANPLDYLDVYVQAGVDLITVHQETVTNFRDTISRIHDLGVQAGLSINPETPLDISAELLDELELFLVMSVHPGFYGQQFIVDVLPKVQNLREIIDQNKLATWLQIDGGINQQTAPLARTAGADVLVAGSAIFKTSDYRSAITGLRQD